MENLLLLLLLLLVTVCCCQRCCCCCCESELPEFSPGYQRDVLLCASVGATKMDMFWYKFQSKFEIYYSCCHVVAASLRDSAAAAAAAPTNKANIALHARLHARPGLALFGGQSLCRFCGRFRVGGKNDTFYFAFNQVKRKIIKRILWWPEERSEQENLVSWANSFYSAS